VSDIELGPIGQVSRSVGDIEQAVRWYRDVLGLPHLYTYGNLAFFDCGGTRLFLSAGTEEGEGPERSLPSIVYFRVPQIHLTYEALTARGVVFRDRPHLVHRHDSGVEEWMAFFDDPDGHPLALMSQVG
jgi:catechol 2,3-dioxygenase-like lactoylglutathione lyase family enzyme